MSAPRDACLAMLRQAPDPARGWWSRIDRPARCQVVNMAGCSVAAVGADWDQLSEAERGELRRVHARLLAQFMRLRGMFDVRGAAGVV
jgi:hypothetical protein